MTKKLFKIAFLSLFLFQLSFAFDCHAQNLKNAFGSDSALDNIADKAGYDKKSTNLEATIGDLLTMVFSFLGVIFLVLMIYGGYLWMMAKGDDAQVTKSKNVMLAAVMGLIIILMSYAISYFVIKNLSEKTLKNGGEAGGNSSDNSMYSSSEYN